MANADDLRSLGEDIANAYDNRIGLIKELKLASRARVKAVSELLKGLATEGRERAKEVKKIRAEVSRLLTQFKQEGKERAEEVANMLSNEQNKRTTQVSDMLKDFHRERSETSAALEELLTKMAAKRGIKSHPTGYQSIRI